MIRFAEISRLLAAAYGSQEGWWPAENAFEIMVGAVLVQRTAWSNAEKAIDRLRRERLLDAAVLALAPPDRVERCIRGAGFFRTKAARLRKLSAFVAAAGGIRSLECHSTEGLRAQLLAIEGIGPETADAILLYGFERPVVVIDAYLRRIAARLTGRDEVRGAGGDAALRESITGEIGDAGRLNEFHALIVAHGKARCRIRPLCGACPLLSRCRTGLRVSPER